MDRMKLDIGELATSARRLKPRKAALEALERLLRAHAVLSGHRDRESPYGILRPATDEEIELIEAVFLYCGVPLPDILRAIYRRTLGVGNPVSSTPVLTVPFLRAILPDEDFGHPIMGIEAFERELGIIRDELAWERPPFLHLGHASPAGLTVSRNGLWSIDDYQGRRAPPPAEDFNSVFEVAFGRFVDQVLVLWANDLAGAPVRSPNLDLARGARLADMPAEVREALSRLVAPAALSAKSWGDIQAIDNPDVLRSTGRSEGDAATGLLASHIAVVGLPYVDRPEAVARIAPGALLRLHPVDDNPHDPNAVEVWRDGDVPVRVGFVQREEAPSIRALLQGSAPWRLRVTDRSDRVLVAALELGQPERQVARDVEPASKQVLGSEQPRDLLSSMSYLIP